MIGKRFIPVFFSALLLILLGCSGGTGNPMLPSSPGHPGEMAGNAAVSNGSTHLWGLWDITIDTLTGQADIVPLRGASFTANVNSLLEGSPGHLIIADMDTSDFAAEGRLDCTIRLVHPLPGHDQFHGFDVWGVFMHHGSTPLGYDGLAYADGSASNEGLLLNPDGYARWYNYGEFYGAGPAILTFTPGKLANLPNPSATLNGYRIFADGLGVSDDYYEWITAPGNADNRGIFRAGTTNSRRYELQFPFSGGNPSATFQYAVVATWSEADPTLTGNPGVYDVGDFPSNANCEEAFFLRTSTDGSDMFNDGTGYLGGTFRADVEVFDWQGGSVGMNGVMNEVESILIKGDFINGGTYTLDNAALQLVAVPATENSSVFQVEITDVTPGPAGEAGFWAIVEAAGENADSYGQDFPTPYPDSRRASFITGTVIISNEGPPQTTAIYVDDSNTTGVEDGTILHPFNTIQEGIDAVPEDWEVWVDDSGNEYDEAVTMLDGVYVKSVNFDETDGSNRAFINVTDAPDVWTLQFNSVSNATIEGFRFGFGGKDTLLNRAGMVKVTGGTGNTVRDCLFNDLTNERFIYAIYIENSEYFTLETNRFEGIDKISDPVAVTNFNIIMAKTANHFSMLNNIITDIRSSSDTSMKNFSMANITASNNLVIKNNLLHHVVLHATGNACLGYGYYFNACNNIEAVNNTTDYLDVRDAFSIQQVFAWWFDGCSTETFDNNIITRIYSNGFPPVLGRGVDAHNGDFVTLNYTDIYITVVNYYGDVLEGTGYISLDPEYIDADNESYDVSATSPCQNGDPSITDWDDTGGGGSRMGCYGGPGGEFVGLLTP